jgi:hypothetical protein
MPPQSFWSKVHLRFNLLLCIGWSIGSIRGLGWEASVVRCLLIRSWMTVRTYRICRSEWSVWLVTYQGPLAMVRRSLGWYLCMIAILDLLAQPHSSIPQVHIGLSIVLLISVLFSSDTGEFFPISHFISRVLWSSCFLFFAIYSLQVNLRSKCNPRYFTVSAWRLTVFKSLRSSSSHLHLHSRLPFTSSLQYRVLEGDF